ncbi:MAG: hypothetical protein CMD89_01305 [Gammaproteobacteria bacterium]|nr:hypothetical protein [Gammaproteobacteria bacterium]
MKVLHLFSSKVFAGLERHIEELSFEQSKNLDVLVIGASRFKKNFRGPYFELNTNEWRYSPFLRNRINKALSSFKPDIVHTHGYKMTDLISKNLSNDYIHCSTIHGTKKKIKAFEQSDFIFAASNASLRKTTQKSMVLENWVCEDRFRNFKKEQPKKFIFIGRLEVVKNPMRLLKAWLNCSAILDIYGEGPLKKKMQSYIEENHLSNRVTIMGQQDDIYKVFQDASALLIPSDREGSPKVLFESLYCNVPVLSTKAGIMSDLLPISCLSETDDISFTKLVKKWVNQTDKLYESQKLLYQKIKLKNVLTAQEKEVRNVYQSLLSKASK